MEVGADEGLGVEVGGVFARGGLVEVWEGGREGGVLVVLGVVGCVGGVVVDAVRMAVRMAVVTVVAVMAVVVVRVGMSR